MLKITYLNSKLISVFRSEHLSRGYCHRGEALCQGKFTKNENLNFSANYPTIFFCQLGFLPKNIGCGTFLNKKTFLLIILFTRKNFRL